MIGFKGFNKDFTCRDMKYKIGEIYKEVFRPILCEKGFHFCKFPLDVFYYYPPEYHSKYALVETDIQNTGAIPPYPDDSKIVTNKIKIIKELSIKDMIDETNKMIEDDTFEGGSLLIQLFYNLHKSSILINKLRDNVKNTKVAISKLRNSLVYSNFIRSMSIASSRTSVAINSGENSLSVSKGCSICSGDNSVAVKMFDDGDYSYSITTGDNSISIVEGFGNCISTGKNSICVANRSNELGINVLSKGDNSIISSTGRNADLTADGDNSTIVHYGYSDAKLIANGKNSICIFYGVEFDEKNDPDFCKKDYIRFKGKLGTLFIAPKYNKVYDEDRNLISIKKEFVIKVVDNEEIFEDVEYYYEDGNFHKVL